VSPAMDNMVTFRARICNYRLAIARSRSGVPDVERMQVSKKSRSRSARRLRIGHSDMGIPLMRGHR